MGSNNWKKWSLTLQMDLLFKHFRQMGDIPTSASNPTDAVLRRRTNGDGASAAETAAVFNSTFMNYPSQVATFNNDPSQGADVGRGLGVVTNDGNCHAGRNVTGLDSNNGFDCLTNLLNFDAHDNEMPSTTVRIVQSVRQLGCA